MQGPTLGAIQLLHPFARGGHGEVWRGDLLGLPVAVKVLRADRTGSTPTDTAHAGEALLREVRALAALDHPHIVPIYDHGRVSDEVEASSEGQLVAGTPWMALGWAEAGSLKGLRGAVGWPELRRHLLELLDALAAAHAEDLLHLDLKPANVLLGPGGCTWLADFGLARRLRHRHVGPSAGTPAYMAPEQVNRALHRLGPWTDLYALGCLTWELVCGRPPFRGSSATDVMRQHQTREPGPLTPVVPVPRELEGWLCRLLHKAPEDRFRHAMDAAHALGSLGAPVAPSPADPDEEPSGAHTFVLDEITAEEVTAPIVGAIPRTVAPMPGPPPVLERRDAPPLQVAHAVPRLLALRRPPRAAPPAPCAALWQRLLEVERVGSAAASVTGPSAPAAITWLERAARRTGAATVVVVRDVHAPVRDALLGTLGIDERELDPPIVAQRLALAAPGHWSALRVGLVTRALRGQVDAVPALTQVLAEAARERPVLVVVHAADPTLTLVARYVRTLLADQPVLVVTPRPLSDVPTIRAPALSPAQGAARLDALVPLAPTLRRALVAAADPEHAHWALRHLAVSGGLVATGDGLDGTPHPTPLDALLADVVDGAPDTLRRLQLLAVLGAHTPLRTWRVACRRDGVGLAPEDLERCADQGLLREEGDEVELSRALRPRVLATADAPTLRALHDACAGAVSSAEAAALHDAAAGHPLRGLERIERRVAAYGPDALPTIAGAVVDLWETLATEVDPAHPTVRRGLALWSWLTPRSRDDPGLDGLEPPATAWVWLGRAHRCRFAGDAPGSLEAARRARAEVTRHPQLVARCRWAEGMAHLVAGDLDAATDAFTEAAALGEVDAGVRLAGSALVADDRSEARRWLQATPTERLRWFQAARWLVLSAHCARLDTPPDGVRARQALDDAERIARGTHRSLALFVACSRVTDEVRAGRRPEVSALQGFPSDRVPAARRGWIDAMIVLFGDASPDLEHLAAAVERVPPGPPRGDLVELLAAAPDVDPRWANHRAALARMVEELETTTG